MRSYGFQGVQKIVIEGLGNTDLHADLFGRSNADSHTMGAITGLDLIVADFEGRITVNEVLLVNHGTRITANEADIGAIDLRVGTLEGDLALAKQVNDDPTNDFIYIGDAVPGSLTSAAAWRIQRVEFTNPGVDDDIEVLWADGNNNFDNIWDNHLVLSYS